MIKRKGRHNPYMMDFQVVSRTSVELAIEIRAYRNKHSLSQAQFAQIATAYGAPYKVKFDMAEISNYERFKVIPTENKMFALLNALGVTIEMLTT